MGFIGGIIGSEIGKVGGRALGSAIGAKLAGKNGKEAGSNIGEHLGRAGGAFLGGLTPFETGGVVGKGKKRGSPIPILAHAGEVVLPLNAHATKQQIRTIEKNVRHHTMEKKYRYK